MLLLFARLTGRRLACCFVSKVLFGSLAPSALACGLLVSSINLAGAMQAILAAIFNFRSPGPGRVEHLLISLVCLDLHDELGPTHVLAQ